MKTNAKYEICIADASKEERPGRNPKEDFNEENWEVIATGQNAETALIELIEAYNDERADGFNSWLRLSIKGEDYYYG